MRGACCRCCRCCRCQPQSRLALLCRPGRVIGVRRRACVPMHRLYPLPRPSRGRAGLAGGKICYLWHPWRQQSTTAAAAAQDCRLLHRVCQGSSVAFAAREKLRHCGWARSSHCVKGVATGRASQAAELTMPVLLQLWARRRKQLPPGRQAARGRHRGSGLWAAGQKAHWAVRVCGGGGRKGRAARGCTERHQHGCRGGGSGGCQAQRGGLPCRHKRWRLSGAATSALLCCNCSAA